MKEGGSKILMTDALPEKEKSPGFLFIITGQSGAGKDTISDWLETQGYKRIVTYTTREPRSKEKDGIAYYFITREEFERLARESFFFETNKLETPEGNLYGSPNKEISEALAGKREKAFLRIDPNGTQRIKELVKALGQEVVAFFIWAEMPEIEKMLRDRMLRDGETDEQKIEEETRKRRDLAAKELLKRDDPYIDCPLHNRYNQLEETKARFAEMLESEKKKWRLRNEVEKGN